MNQNANLSPVPDPTFMDVPEREDPSTGPFELLQSALHGFIRKGNSEIATSAKGDSTDVVQHTQRLYKHFS